MASETKWFPEQFKAELKAHIDRNLDMAASTLASFIRGSFGSSGQSGGRSGATKAQRAGNRSMPWGPPNVDTGHLKRNIGFEKPVDRPSVRRVGTGIGNAESVGYALWLESGTRRMRPRPFLRPALSKTRRRLKMILSRPM